MPGYLRRALGAKKRAEALGGTLAAWGADTFAFDFATEEMEEAIDLAVATFDDLTLGIEPRFSAGVAHGPLTRLGMSGSLAMLAWGEALVVATVGRVELTDRGAGTVTHGRADCRTRPSV